MPTAGYSGTPLLKKLGVKDEQTALLVGVPETVTELNSYNKWRRLKTAKTLRGCNGGPYDYIHFFTADEGLLQRAIPILKRELQQAGMIWISWPKKSSGVLSTVTEDIVRKCALKQGLVDIKVCAIDNIWSGLKLVIPVKDRKI
ncbi:MAG: DUF3052 domain-containing protein [Pseudomonadota bacterium]